jgi:hypothetical protein
MACSEIPVLSVKDAARVQMPPALGDHSVAIGLPWQGNRI